MIHCATAIGLSTMALHVIPAEIDARFEYLSLENCGYAVDVFVVFIYVNALLPDGPAALFCVLTSEFSTRSSFQNIHDVVVVGRENHDIAFHDHSLGDGEAYRIESRHRFGNGRVEETGLQLAIYLEHATIALDPTRPSAGHGARTDGGVTENCDVHGLVL